MKSYSYKREKRQKLTNRQSVYEMLTMSRSPTDGDSSTKQKRKTKVGFNRQTMLISQMRDTAPIILVFNKTEEAPKVTRADKKLQTKKIKTSLLNALIKVNHSMNRGKPFYLLDLMPTKRKGHVQRISLKTEEKNISLKERLTLQQEVQKMMTDSNPVGVRYKNILLSMEVLQSLRNRMSVCKKETTEVNTGVVNIVVQNQMKRLAVLNQRVEHLKKRESK